MASPATVQEALRRFAQLDGLDPQRRKVCRHLLACRTEAMGKSIWQCEQCRHEESHYHGCRDRHCPQCQSRATRLWVERQRRAVLPVAYHHLVFTLPHALNGWVQRHPEVLYRLLFESAWATVKTFGEDPKRLGGQMGMSAVLHTWSQTLVRHVHLHCLVPGGALAADGGWRPVKSPYLFPVRALSRHFRGRMVRALRASARVGELNGITRAGELDRGLDALMQQDWVVYSKPCLSHTESVVEYLGRYTHRIAITNARILKVDAKGVTLRHRDRQDDRRTRTMVLDGPEFVRRYLLHVLPKGLMRIRHFGFLANRGRARKLERIRAALAELEVQGEAAGEELDPTAEGGYRCPVCRVGHLHVISQRWPPRTRESSVRRR